MLTHRVPPKLSLLDSTPSFRFSAKTFYRFFFLVSDVSDMGWGVPVYDSEENAPRSPRSSVDINRTTTRRGSIDEGRAPSRKSLDLNSLRDNVNTDPPLR